MENFGLETTQQNQSTMPVSQFLFMRPDEDRDRPKDKHECERERQMNTQEEGQTNGLKKTVIPIKRYK